ncbi:multicomponent Na+:H+ antiporter subunit G [Amycolatopsis echigonensis]|uniref:Multicomponent Na+:H+ antiporter subunit G n=1 Tax=Amycolatopsis echigonensis TaxID=2576905 RepID=A0A2N3WR76_9PSEU|nr:monovalent cation/H(+) antiporter subunit G [Amycolatopsis niigatensis]PKV96360.1 multicomponent Na+:H+ antiporter subunit G [Amycolatopsis niigatensis]
MTVAAQILVFAGVFVILASSAGLVRAKDLLTRLHLLSPATTLGAPLIGVGLVLVNGVQLGSGAILATVVLLAVTGPILQSATARLEARHRGEADEDLPS